MCVSLLEEVEDNDVDSEVDNEEVRDSVDERVGVEESVSDFESVPEEADCVPVEEALFVVDGVDVAESEFVSEFERD